MMEQAALRRLAESVRNAANPIVKGRELLLEEYRKTRGVDETRVRVSAEFELKRSVVVQAAYESFFGGGAKGPESWLSVARIGREHADALDARRHCASGGLISALRKSFPDSLETADFILRSALESEALGHERFLGSVRFHVPGVGYAVSVRKRYNENQDSFALQKSDGRAILILGDGCGSARFAALASHLAVREASARARNGMRRADIIEISRHVRDMVNDETVRTAAGNPNDSGISTLLVGMAEGGKARVFKVGDSIPFIAWNDRKADFLEVLAKDYCLREVIGQQSDLQDANVEEYEREAGRMVLTSDGVTNYLGNPAREIAQWTRLSYDPVMIAERLLRSVLRNQIKWGHSDDVTIIVHDLQGI